MFNILKRFARPAHPAPKLQTMPATTETVLALRQRIKQERAASFVDRFEAIADWWIDLPDDAEPDEATEEAGHQFAGMAGRIHGQHFSDKAISAFFETVYAIQQQEKSLSFGQITVQLRDATFQLMVS